MTERKKFENKMIYSTDDNTIYSVAEAKMWYLDLLKSGDIDIEDYPTFDDYYDSLFDMDMVNYECTRVDVKDFNIYHVTRTEEYIAFDKNGVAIPLSNWHYNLDNILNELR